MILLRDNMLPLLKKHFGFTDQVINELRAKYFQSVVNLIINNTLTYLEENHKEADIKVIRDLSLRSKNSESTEDIVELTKQIYSFPEKYPELAKLIKDDISEFNSAMFQDFLKVADEDTITELLQIGAKEVAEVSHIP